jgi:hypothetical protein
MKLKLFFMGLVFLTFTGCKEDEPAPPPNLQADSTLEIQVQPVFGSEILHVDSIYSTFEGYDVQFLDVKFYFTSVQNGSTPFTSAGLFDWRANGNAFISTKGEPSSFSNLTANLGVGTPENNSDPSAFPNDNPLNIAISNDMHWDWNPGYIFMKIEAKVDTIADGNALFNHYVIFHVGLNVNLQTVSFTGLNWAMISPSLHRSTLKLDLAKVLQNNGQNIDLKTEFTCHSAPGQEILATKIIENFKSALDKL